MARIQILELPTVYDGDTSETPFAVIIDQADDTITKAVVDWRAFADGFGARTAVIFIPDLSAFAPAVEAAIDDANRRLAGARQMTHPRQGADATTLANAEERLQLAKQALLHDGYFRPDEIGDDVAPRITERLTAAREEIDQLRSGEDAPQAATMDPTPGNLLHKIHSLNRTDRLAFLQQLGDASARGNICTFHEHDRQLQEAFELRSALSRLRDLPAVRSPLNENHSEQYTAGYSDGINAARRTVDHPPGSHG